MVLTFFSEFSDRKGLTGNNGEKEKISAPHVLWPTETATATRKKKKERHSLRRQLVHHKNEKCPVDSTTSQRHENRVS